MFTSRVEYWFIARLLPTSKRMARVEIVGLFGETVSSFDQRHVRFTREMLFCKAIDYEV